MAARWVLLTLVFNAIKVKTIFSESQDTFHYGATSIADPLATFGCSMYSWLLYGLLTHWFVLP